MPFGISDRIWVYFGGFGSQIGDFRVFLLAPGDLEGRPLD